MGKVFESWEELIQASERNRVLITEDGKRDSGKFVKMHGSGQYALLLGVVEGYDDFYWVTIRHDLKVMLETCVGGYDVIEGELPPALSVLKWMQDNDEEGLLERVKNNLILDDTDKIIVDIKVK